MGPVQALFSSDGNTGNICNSTGAAWKAAQANFPGSITTNPGRREVGRYRIHINQTYLHTFYLNLELSGRKAGSGANVPGSKIVHRKVIITFGVHLNETKITEVHFK